MPFCESFRRQVMPQVVVDVAVSLVLFVSIATTKVQPWSPPTSAISLRDFPEHVAKMHANGDFGFSKEHELIRNAKRYPAVASDANAEKNRYHGKVNAYDHSRFRLSSRVDSSDYINANYIDGYNSEKEYIATQGPTPATMNDFWQMVWEADVHIIVMVTSLNEGGMVKCDQYWPDKGQVWYDNVSVKFLTEDSGNLPTYVVRTFEVLREDEVRVVKQYHFLLWPDHGVPEQSTPLLSFVREVRANVKPEDGPMVVHCSAGVGRTGTFIAIDQSLQWVDRDTKLDIFGVVLRMRQQRNLMVHNEAQYTFIHDALLEVLNSSATGVPASNFSSKQKEL
ncbi:receptor-type tyrosine-protein phosphatase S-like [Oscarella lobularis]|uniref:receptor-type tyrosine-protein phosphatase S-like n=1 Tax=Oscarella lobularis TaxID=121494 RepID=UPI003313CF63